MAALMTVTLLSSSIALLAELTLTAITLVRGSYAYLPYRHGCDNPNSLELRVPSCPLAS
jgi:hypothetical protein